MSKKDRIIKAQFLSGYLQCISIVATLKAIYLTSDYVTLPNSLIILFWFGLVLFGFRGHGIYVMFKTVS